MELDRRLTLEEARQIINEQDRIIAEAFEKRMAAAREVVRNKMEQGLPIYVPEREEEILNRIASAVPEELSGYATEVFRKLMEVFLRRFTVCWRNTVNRTITAYLKWNRKIWRISSDMDSGQVLM